MLCDAEDCTDIAEFAEAKLALLRRFVKLEHGAPRHDTFSRVFRLLEPEPFERPSRNSPPYAIALP